MTNNDINTKMKQMAISNFKAGFGGKLMPRIELSLEKMRLKNGMKNHMKNLALMRRESK